ncbi:MULTISPECIES: hypothetical protein [Cyanophyceae]|uniref:Uncharacterized protein n=1 Tax=Leptolyngbya subtilissima DQ-A4 TaxID=2933933 RepID=A0ABV0K8M9_9CYAN|nr:hypothetical protein [Nodosilinea sp. FACHB-141]MBD2110295.1 hypothetical protein [Nodosilinea sp. FACHB-141]
MTKLAQQFSDLRPAIANAAQQIANVAQQFGIAGPEYSHAAGQLKARPSALR